MANEPDWGQVESQLKAKAGQWYDPTMLQDVQRNSSYGAAGGANNVDDWVNRVANKAQLRGSNEVNSNYVATGQGGVTVGPTGKVNNPNNDDLSGLTPDQLKPQTGGGGSSMASWSGSSSGAPSQDPRFGELYNLLMGRAKQSLNVDANDPIIRNQVDAANATGQRQLRSYLTDQAEAGGAYYNPTGQARMMNEKLAQSTSGLQSQLIGNELNSRRTEIQNALSQMGGMLTADQQLDLQKELGMIDANLRQQGITSGNDQFAQTFGLNKVNQANYWDALRSGLLNG